MNKDRDSIDYSALKKKAYELVVIQGRMQKDVAKILNVSEKTISDWSVAGNWQELKTTNEVLNCRRFMEAKLFDVMADIALIEDKELRVRIANKLTGRA